MKYISIFLFLFLLVLAGCQSCMDDNFGGDVVSSGLPDVVEDSSWWGDTVENIEDVEDVIEDVEEEVTQAYIDECYQSQYFYCPPFDAIWQQEIVMDICEDPPVIISIAECAELFECDPSQVDIGIQDCIDPNGWPGEQQNIQA